MGAFSLRLPESLHEQVRQLARRQGISINQFIATAVAEKLSALMTEEHLEKRARRGDRVAFDEVLGRVDEPDQGDGVNG
jgi:hypothetical protein